METSKSEDIVAALDIGSSKVSVAVARIDGLDNIDVIGFGKVPAYGISNGSVQYIELAVEAIRSAVYEASQTSGHEITRLVAAVTGKHLHCVNKVGRHVLSGNEINADDVKAALRQAMHFDPKEDDTDIDPKLRGNDTQIVTHYVKGFTIDEDETMRPDPMGMVGDVLNAHVHLAVGPDSIIRNHVKCITKVGLDVDGLVIHPWASAAACLTKTDRELGSILLDFGAGATNIACYSGGSVEYTAVADRGGNLVSRDIAAGLHCSIDDAEEIKLSYGHLEEGPNDDYAKIRYVHEPTGEEREVNCRELVHIIEPRVQEILTWIVTHYLAPGGWRYRAASGVVVTGGMAKMPGFVDYVQKTLGLPTRLAAPKLQSAAGINLTDPEDSVVMGVLAETVRRRMFNTRKNVGSKGFFPRFVKRAVFGDFYD